MPLAYKIYEKSDTDEKVHVWDAGVIKHYKNNIEVNDIANKDDYIRDDVLYMNEDELKENGFKLISQT